MFNPGVLTADQAHMLNQLWRQYQQGFIRTVAPLDYSLQPTGEQILSLNLTPNMFWAEIIGSGSISVSGSGSLQSDEVDGDTRAYTWVERTPGPTRKGAWRNGSRSGTLNAYQVEPQLGLTPTRVVSPGSIVIMWLAPDGVTYNFVPVLPGVDAGQPLQLDLLVGLCDNKILGSNQGSSSTGLNAECPSGYPQQWSFTLASVTYEAGANDPNRTWTLALGIDQWTETYDNAVGPPLTATLEIVDTFFTLTFSSLGILAVYQFDAGSDDCCVSHTLDKIYDSSSDGYGNWPATIALTAIGGCASAGAGSVESPSPVPDSGGPGLDLTGLIGIYQRVELPPGTRDLGRYCKPIVACGPKDCGFNSDLVTVQCGSTSYDIPNTLKATISASAVCTDLVGVNFLVTYQGVQDGRHTWTGFTTTSSSNAACQITPLVSVTIEITEAGTSCLDRTILFNHAVITNQTGNVTYSPFSASLADVNVTVDVEPLI